MDFRSIIKQGIATELPQAKPLDGSVSHAPKRKKILSEKDRILALRNALRYFPKHQHQTLAKEFANELDEYGRIYMHRFRPEYEMYARPISEYPAKCQQAAAIMLMIQNNLDPAVAQHPHELITYGGNGAVFQNWAQYLLTMKYLSEMTDDQTLTMYSGHPMGLYPSHKDAPRVVVTNGMMIPNYSQPDDWEKFNALGVTQYGQMTAGSYMYIGPQGIVHGTTITVLNASRKVRQNSPAGGKRAGAGVLFVTSGLGGMSGAQPKAGNIAGAVTICAEINETAATKRHEQGWVDELVSDVDACIDLALEWKTKEEPRSIAFVGNVVGLWERLAEREIKVELGSDQTSLHNPWAGGYYPIGLTYEESNEMMANDPDRFKEKVQETLRRHVAAVNQLAENGMYFFDYGNAFLLESGRAGADVFKESDTLTSSFSDGGQLSSPPEKGEWPKAEGVSSHPVQGEQLMNKTRLKHFRTELRSNLTQAEAKLWDYLKAKKVDGRKFRRQHSVGSYIVDFYCPSEKLAIELDGEPHNSVVAVDYDYERTLFLNEFGIKVIRFENKLVFEQPEMVLEAIKQEFNWIEKTPSPSGDSPFSGGEQVGSESKNTAEFRYPSYVQDIMGPMCFDYGFGPFRWVCASGKPEDLQATDTIAAQIIEELLLSAPSEIRGQLQDNLLWVREAQKNKLVVGSQARILYADAEGRTKIAAAFNQAIKEGKIGPVVLGRDHHDVSGTDSPYRETSNIYDGSQFTADMAVQNFVGDGFRGATWISLHNGGGVGWGEVMNGGFGMLLDGSEDADRRLRMMLHWDVNNGISRRSWARNEEAVFAIKRAMKDEPKLKVTLPNFVDDDILKEI